MVAVAAASGVGGNGAMPAVLLVMALLGDPVINGLPQYGTLDLVLQLDISLVVAVAGYYSGGAVGAYGGGGNGGPPTSTLSDRSGKANTGGGGEEWVTIPCRNQDLYNQLEMVDQVLLFLGTQSNGFNASNRISRRRNNIGCCYSNFC